MADQQHKRHSLVLELPITSIIGKMQQDGCFLQYLKTQTMTHLGDMGCSADNCNYSAEAMRYEGLFDAAREAIKNVKESP